MKSMGIRDLLSRASVESASQEFVAQRRIFLKAERQHLPSPTQLFDLGADAVAGSQSREWVAMRMRAAREMAGLSAKQLREPIMAGSEGSARSLISQYENGKKPVPDKVLTAWARDCRVSSRWLREGGDPDQEAWDRNRNGSDPGKEEIMTWLTPWHHAVIAGSTLIRNDGEIHFTEVDTERDPTAARQAIEVLRRAQKAASWTLRTEGWLIGPGDDQNTTARKRMVAIAAISAAIRACRRARENANTWTVLAWTVDAIRVRQVRVPKKKRRAPATQKVRKLKDR